MSTKEELLYTLTVKQLKQLAKDNNVSLVEEHLIFDSVASTKDEIIDVLLDSDKITKEKIFTIKQESVSVHKQDSYCNSKPNAPQPIITKATDKIQKVAPSNFGQPSNYYCNVCKQAISEKVYTYSNAHFGKPLCMNHQRVVIPQTCN
jgi:hypothetical protein